MRIANKSRWLALPLVGLILVAGGCDGANWLSFTIVIPMGLDGDFGIFNPYGEGSPFIPVDGTDSTEPPPPIQGGEIPGGDTGGITGGTGLS